MKVYAVFGLSTMYKGDIDIIVLPLGKSEFAYFEISDLKFGNYFKTTLEKKFSEKNLPTRKLLKFQII